MVDQIFSTFVNWKYDAKTWFITGLNGSLYMYLLEGEEKALLIDTAYGLADVKAYCEKLTDKPILVANTHGHLDHSGGNGYFKQVYMHEKAMIDFQTYDENLCDYKKLPYPDYEKIYLREGDRIDLGGREIEVIDISAHSNSSLAYLDKSHRLLFCGDELEAAQVLMYPLVEKEEQPYDFTQRIRKHKGNMEKLWARKDDFDFCCPGHNGAPIAKDYILDFIGLSEAVLDGSVQIEDKINHPYIEMSPVGKELCRARFQKASFLIRKDHIGRREMQ